MTNNKGSMSMSSIQGFHLQWGAGIPKEDRDVGTLLEEPRTAQGSTALWHSSDCCIRGCGGRR